MTLILASGSPRRRALLRAAGIPFRAASPREVDETPISGETPRALVQRLAKAKARYVANAHPRRWVLGCDTEVVLGAKVLGKPKGILQARRMILALSHGSHQVLTGLVLIAPNGKIAMRDCVTSRVTFGRIPENELQSYLRTREPYDKAGGYGIQGRARNWVTGLTGDYFNVMGLPVSRVVVALIRHGLWR